MWLRSSPAIGTAAPLHGRDLQALLVSICPRKWHLGHVSICPTVPALHQPSSLPFPLCLTGTQLCAPSSSSPSAGDALASSSSWLVVLMGHCDPSAEETRCLEQRLQPPSPSHGTLGAAGTPGQAVPACWHPSVLKPPPALTQTASFGAPDQTGFQCGTLGTMDNGGEKTRGAFPTEVPGNESGPTTCGEGDERDTLHSSQHSREASWDFFPYVLYPLCYRLYLQHHHTDLFDTLDNCVGCPRDCHRPLRGVGQHVPRHLHLSTCGLETERERKEKSHS